MLQDLDGHRFSFYVVSAAPQEVIQSALEGIVPEENIFGPVPLRSRDGRD